jgi:hypothetical protein
MESQSLAFKIDWSPSKYLFFGMFENLMQKSVISIVSSSNLEANAFYLLSKNDTNHINMNMTKKSKSTTNIPKSFLLTSLTNESFKLI